MIETINTHASSSDMLDSRSALPQGHSVKSSRLI